MVCESKKDVMNMLTPGQAAVADYDKNFIADWNRVFAENAAASADSVWLAGPSSYVFSLGGVRFSVDLQIRRERDFAILAPKLKEQLSGLSFMLITHEHEDHMCRPLMALLKDTPMHWYIPADCNRELIYGTGLSEERITWVEPGDRWRIGDLAFSAFHTPHAKPGAAGAVQRGYAIMSPKGKILIPGDIRDYDYSGYPDFGGVDLCISHLWAGNDSLHKEAYMPYLQQFVKTSAGFGAKRYFLCHLYEIGREDDKLWDFAHAGLAMEEFYRQLPESVVEIPRIGRGYGIWTNRT